MPTKATTPTTAASCWQNAAPQRPARAPRRATTRSHRRSRAPSDRAQVRAQQGLPPDRHRYDELAENLRAAIAIAASTWWCAPRYGAQPANGTSRAARLARACGRSGCPHRALRGRGANSAGMRQRSDTRRGWRSRASASAPQCLAALAAAATLRGVGSLGVIAGVYDRRIHRMRDPPADPIRARSRPSSVTGAVAATLSIANRFRPTTEVAA